MFNFSICPCSKSLQDHLRHKIDSKTKPKGSLGILEDLAFQIGLIQNTLTPSLSNPLVLLFAGDHGIAQSGVSAYPQEVTYQMVLNFLQSGAAINVFCKQHAIHLKIIDAGVKSNFDPHANLIIAKIGEGTNNFLEESAMSEDQCLEAITVGARITREQIAFYNSNIIGFGEMGIGNTSSASMISSILCNLVLEDCIGRGTGLTDEQLESKKHLLSSALKTHKDIVNSKDPVKILSTFGGYEIAMMVGGYLQAAESNCVILVDGFIATSAFLVAVRLYPSILDYAIFSHLSEERGHKLVLEYLGARPILSLKLRLGEGTGCALVYPLILSAINFLNNMSSFEEANVSTQKG